MRAGLIVLTVLACVSSRGLAQETKHLPHPSTASEADHNFSRAGNPQSQSRFATMSLEAKEGPGLIGGGKLFGGDGPASTDGTFGWDYQGRGWHPGRFFLGWAHDRKHQPKPGPYTTDTYKIPDPIALHPIRRVLAPRENAGH